MFLLLSMMLWYRVSSFGVGMVYGWSTKRLVIRVVCLWLFDVGMMIFLNIL